MRPLGMDMSGNFANEIDIDDTPRVIDYFYGAYYSSLKMKEVLSSPSIYHFCIKVNIYPNTREGLALLILVNGDPNTGGSLQ